MNLDNVDFEGCDFKKADIAIVHRMLMPDMIPEYSGGDEAIYKSFVDKKIISDAMAPVHISISRSHTWKDVECDGVEIQTAGVTIVSALVNFVGLVSLLKNECVLTISLSH